MSLPSPCLASFALRLSQASDAPVRQFERALALAALAMSLCAGSATADAQTATPLWRDTSASIETRVNDLLKQLTLKEKISQIGADPLAIPRLGIPAYSHRNEGLHGIVGGDLPTTVFPQVIGMAATWDTPLIQQEADAISTEARARYNAYAAKHDRNVVKRYGLTYYSPNINLFRDPRWGRGQETYGEDPFLTGRMAVAFIRGLQGDDPRYIKIMACAKHFAVHSGPEKLRHQLNATPPERDLYETYLPAFEAAVREGRVGSVMGIYNALYGIPGCASPLLIQDILRGQWGFTGLHVSDGGAVWDIWGGHHYTPTPEEAVAAALKAGCDVSSGNVTAEQAKLEPDIGFRSNITDGWLGGGMDYNMLQVALEKNLVTEADIDRAVRNELTARFRVGLFDPPEMSPWAKLTQADSGTPAHRALAQKVAEESIVLLKNDGLLPLDRAKYKRIAVIGPNADTTETLSGNYGGSASKAMTLLQGIKKLAGPGVEVVYERGSPLAMRKNNSNAPAKADTDKTLALAKSADLIIYIGGITGKLECEEPRSKNYNYKEFDIGDRITIELPAVQESLVRQLHALGKPMIIVNCSGSAMAMPWEAENIPAIVQAWYPGQSGATALARVLFGEVNPAGRLPVTFYASTADLPAFTDYSMANRTYKYFTGKPLYAFGHGLSYTTFAYENAALTAADGRARSPSAYAFSDETMAVLAPTAPDSSAQGRVCETLGNDAVELCALKGRDNSPDVCGAPSGRDVPHTETPGSRGLDPGLTNGTPLACKALASPLNGYPSAPPPAFTPADTLRLTFTLRNTGARDGDEVPQVYFRHLDSTQPQPKLALCGFTRVTLDKNAQKQITIEIPASRLRYYDTAAKRYTVEPGNYELLLAAASDDIRATLPFSIK